MAARQGRMNSQVRRSILSLPVDERLALVDSIWA
jgi:hypothetical protein